MISWCGPHFGAGRHQLGQGHAAPSVAPLGPGSGRFVDACQPQENVADAPLLSGRCGVVNGVGRAGNGLAHAPQVAVLLRPQPAPVPALPQLEQGMLQERHRPRLAGHAVQDGVGQVGLEAQPHRGGLLLHGQPQLGCAHGRDQLLVRLHRSLQRRIGCAVAPEVGAHRKHDVVLRREGQQAVDEGPALGVIGGGGEELLELVDDE